MSKATAVKNSTSKRDGGTDGGGLYLPDPSIEGAIDGVVSDELLAKGFNIVMPYYKQGEYYRFFITELDGPSIYFTGSAQALEQGVPIVIKVPSEESLKLKGRQVVLHYWYQEFFRLVSSSVVMTMGTPSSAD